MNNHRGTETQRKPESYSNTNKDLRFRTYAFGIAIESVERLARRFPQTPYRR